MTDLAEIFRYASVGVKMSAGMVAHSGTIFGEFGAPSDSLRTRCMVSKDGSTLD